MQSAGKLLVIDVLLVNIGVIIITAFELRLGLHALFRRLTPWIESTVMNERLKITLLEHLY